MLPRFPNRRNTVYFKTMAHCVCVCGTVCSGFGGVSVKQWLCGVCECVCVCVGVCMCVCVCVCVRERVEGIK